MKQPSSREPERRHDVRLRPAGLRHAPIIAGWVLTPEDLLMLAPSTPPPLTADKVLAWRKPQGHSFIAQTSLSEGPVGYGELNPMRRDPHHYWLGHVIVHPELRGKGLGLALVQALLDEAFARLTARQVSLIVFPQNTAAIRCYERAGLAAVGTETHRLGETGGQAELLRMQIDRRH